MAASVIAVHTHMEAVRIPSFEEGTPVYSKPMISAGPITSQANVKQEDTDREDSRKAVVEPHHHHTCEVVG